jgi:hypothetical protein
MPSARRSKLRLYDERLQRGYISAVVPRLVNRCFGDERRMGQAKVIQQNSECLLADVAGASARAV